MTRRHTFPGSLVILTSRRGGARLGFRGDRVPFIRISRWQAARVLAELRRLRDLRRADLDAS
jgi:hypothetical protein